MRVLWLAAAVFSASVALANDSIVGKWVAKDPSGVQVVVDLQAFGRGTIDGDAITWSVQGDRLITMQDGERVIYRYRMENGQMIISGGDLEGTLRFTQADRPAANPTPANTAAAPAPARQQPAQANVAGLPLSMSGPNGEKLDTELSQADVDAAVDVLSFMWVCAGRSQAHITPEAQMLVRNGIIANYRALPIESQLYFANATVFGPAIRTTWNTSTGQARAELARRYGAALDELGLADPDARQAAGSSSSDAEWEIKSGLMMNTCWNLAQKATR